MEKYILITAVVIMIIILALDFIFSKDGYQCHSCKKRFHKEDLEIKGWHFKEWVCPNCKHINYTYVMKKIREWFKSLVVGEVPNPKHVFNCRDLIWISSLETSQNTPECFTHYFYLYWSNGMVVKVCQESHNRNSYQELYKLRELFINNMGYSYVPIEDNSEIYIFINVKKDI